MPQSKRADFGDNKVVERHSKAAIRKQAVEDKGVPVVVEVEYSKKGVVGVG